jgi:hypothetical protein
MKSAAFRLFRTLSLVSPAIVFQGASPVLAQLAQAPVTQDLNLSAPVGKDSVQMRAAQKMAGALDWFVFRGVQYIDNYDHGRELQSALSIDALGECYNPTEAGGRDDHLRGIASSRWLAAWKSPMSLMTTTDMGFWLKPGTNYGGTCGSTTYTTAQNRSVRGNYLLTKTVTVGWRGIRNVLDYRITFTVPERRSTAVFEALTGYMPAVFSKFYAFDPSLQKLVSLSDGPGEQSNAVVIATADGRSAMGVISPQLPQPAFPGAGYGRWRFTAANVTKWNCVVREKDIYVGDYSYRCFVVFGTRTEVENAIRKLWRIFRHQSFPASRPTSDVAPSNYQTILLYRSFNGKDHFLSTSSTEGTNAGYTPEGPKFRVYRYGYRTEMVPAFRCYNEPAAFHFLSTEGMCAGVNVEEIYGFISPVPAIGLKALHLFEHPIDHHLLSTTDYNEGVNASYNHLGVQGYVP